MTFKIVIIKFNKQRDGLELELDDNIKTTVWAYTIFLLLIQFVNIGRLTSLGT